MCVVLSFPFDYPFIAYFLKKKYSLRQNILKILRVWERSLTSVPIGVYLGLIKVGTWLGTGSTKEHWRFTKKSDRTLDWTLLLVFGQFTGGEPLLHKSDWTLKQYLSCIRSNDVSAFDQAKMMDSGSIGLCLRLVKGNWTCLVMTWGDLDLSVVDWALGGSVRSLSPERPVSRKHLDLGLYSFPFLIHHRGAII